MTDTITLVCTVSGNDAYPDYDHFVLQMTKEDIRWILSVMNTAAVLKSQDDDFYRITYFKHMFEVTGAWDQLFVGEEEDFDDLQQQVDDGGWTYIPDAPQLLTSQDIDIRQVLINDNSVVLCFYLSHTSDELESQILTKEEILEYLEILETREAVARRLADPHPKIPYEIDARTIEVDSVGS